MTADHGLWSFALGGEAMGAGRRGKLGGANAGLVTPARPQACSERVNLGQHRYLKLFGKAGLQRDLEPCVRLDRSTLPSQA